LALLGSGMMDLAAVGGIAALITLERVARRPDRAARAAGILLLAAAALRIPPVGERARSLGLGFVVSVVGCDALRVRPLAPTVSGLGERDGTM
jgi:uncharacterized membrane protein YhhN